VDLKDEIETSIASTLKPDMRRIYYDLKYTYFEGKEKNHLVLFSYSQDKERGTRLLSTGQSAGEGYA